MVFVKNTYIFCTKAWVLNVDTNCDNSKYLAAFSNRQVNVYGENLTTVTNIRVPHEKAVTKCAFRYSIARFYYFVDQLFDICCLMRI